MLPPLIVGDCLVERLFARQTAGVAIRVYADTSVFGGVFDPEFAEASRRFFDLVASQTLKLVTSSVVAREIERAPAQVQSAFRASLVGAEVLRMNEAAVQLAASYVEAGILSARSADDSLHVALASIGRCDIIVRWNFRDIVRFAKIPLYNEVNGRFGFGSIAIHSPHEVVRIDEQAV
jgi:predicted nucleic acid-binding protein